jgi:HD-GYP domain-containing protein (c-di-GMP phosphodiesterase class II)
LTHSRPYKAASSLEEALAEIQKERERQFDPRVVDALMKLASSQDLLQLDQALLGETATTPLIEPEPAPVTT